MLDLDRVLEYARAGLTTKLGVLSMDRLDRAFRRARADLRVVGLLDDGRYLDRIDCVRAALPALGGELGYVYDRGVPWFSRLAGFRPGVIYIPLNPSVSAYVPGGTLVDTIRHEFGHAWAWLDRKFIDRRWFRDTFGARYDATWDGAPAFDGAEFVSSYACTAPAEDFAETFMTFLRCRRSLSRFARRPGVHRKLTAVARAVAVAASERAPRISGTAPPELHEPQIR